MVVLVGQVNDLGMTLRENREGAFGADHVDRLPEAIQDQNRLGEYRVHLEFGRLRHPFRLSSADGTVPGPGFTRMTRDEETQH